MDKTMKQAAKAYDLTTQHWCHIMGLIQTHCLELKHQQQAQDRTCHTG